MKKRVKPPAARTGDLLATRLCLKNLPRDVPGDGAAAVAAFLRSRLPDLRLTDARVLPGRRMAFVGVASAEEARTVVRTYNRAYFGTSRIVVELAAAPRKAAAADDGEVAGPKAPPTTETTARNPRQEKEDRRKKEFVAVMGGSKSDARPSKAWTNDDGDIREPTNHHDDDASVSNSSDTDSLSSDSSPDDKTPIRVDQAQSDLDFLKSKIVPVDDLEERGNVNDDIGAEHGNTTENSDTDSDESDSQSAASSHSKQQNRAGGGSARDPNTGALPETLAHDPCRLFLRNLPFVTTEDDVYNLFAPYSPKEVHLPVDDQSNNKGFGFVTLASSSDAQNALKALDGTDFKGRLLHILPARSNTTNTNAESDVSMSYKQKQEQRKRQDAEKETTGWSASYVRGDAVIDTLAERLGLRKSSVLDVKDKMTGGEAAVRLALGETAIIEENRKYFAEHGIDMEKLVSVHRDDDKKNEGASPTTSTRSRTNILVKNLPAHTTEAELQKLFGGAGGNPTRILLPPSRTIAVIEYGHANEAKVSFKRLAYKRFHSAPLYLEWAPLATNKTIPSTNDGTSIAGKLPQTLVDVEGDAADMDMDDSSGPISTVFIKNLSFATSEEQLAEFLSDYAHDIRAVRIPKKVVPLKKPQLGDTSTSGDPVREISMGYGFVEFRSSESARKVIKELRGRLLDGHALELQLSRKKESTPSVGTKVSKNSAKLMVRNVPFQATRKELIQLFGSYGQLKKVRLPKKFAGGHRGFCFIEYLTRKEAEAAMATLSRTHLYGRHLVIEWATKEDEENDLNHLREKARQAVDHDASHLSKKIRYH